MPLNLNPVDHVKLAASIAEIGVAASVVSSAERVLRTAIRNAEDELNMLSLLGSAGDPASKKVAEFLKNMRAYYDDLFVIAHNTTCDVGPVLDAVRRLTFTTSDVTQQEPAR